MFCLACNSDLRMLTGVAKESEVNLDPKTWVMSNLLTKFRGKQLMFFKVILLTDRQRNKQTNQPTRSKH